MTQLLLRLARPLRPWRLYEQPLCERARCRCGRTFARHIDAPDGTLCPRCEPPDVMQPLRESVG